MLSSASDYYWLSSRAAPDPALADRDFARHCLLRLIQGQGQNAVFELGADLLPVDLVRQRERPGEMPDIVFGIERLHAVVFRRIDLRLDLQHLVLNTDINRFLVDPRHLHDHGQRVLGLEDVGRRRVGAKMPLPGLSGAAAERYGATSSSAGSLMPYRFNEPRLQKIPRARSRVQNW